MIPKQSIYPFHLVVGLFAFQVGERLCNKLGAQADAGEIVDAKQIFGESRLSGDTSP